MTHHHREERGWNLPSGPFIQKIERLEDELETLRQRLDDMKRTFGLDADIGGLLALGLSRAQARAVGLLLKRPISTNDQVMFAIYIHDPDRRHEVSENMARVHLSNARKKLRKYGIKIDDGRREGYPGYRISDEHKAKLKSLMDRQFLKQAAE